jgi:hypothetical protein
MTVRVSYYAETPTAITIQNHHIENTVLRNAIRISGTGIITIFIGSALDLIYLNAISILVRFAKEHFLIHTEEDLQGQKN